MRVEGGEGEFVHACVCVQIISMKMPVHKQTRLQGHPNKMKLAGVCRFLVADSQCPPASSLLLGGLLLLLLLLNLECAAYKHA